MISEPEDKLDAAAQVVVSGPEDAALEWRQIDWRRAERNVRRLRQRIFTASKAGDLARVRRLQKLMLRSHSNTLVSVRRVTERNAGRLTAGVDGEVVLTPKAKTELAWVARSLPAECSMGKSGWTKEAAHAAPALGEDEGMAVACCIRQADGLRTSARRALVGSRVWSRCCFPCVATLCTATPRTSARTRRSSALPMHLHGWSVLGAGPAFGDR
jgi:hypothetical protein